MKNPLHLSALAMDGGPPVRSKSFPPWPYYEPDEMEAVTAVLASGRVNYWTGEEGRQFESEFAAQVGTQHAVAVMNGSVALELALRALGLGPGDEVVVPARSFIASASSVVLVGARPVFADVDPLSGNLTAESIAAVLSPRTRAVIVVHLGGWPCDMDSISALTQARGLRLIEDCAQAHGATYKGRQVGSFGAAAAFSFCQDKIMSTGGEGGMLVCNDETVWQRAWSYKDHGKSWDAVYRRQHPPGFRWLHESFGSNWRMTEMQAAIGRRQLKKLSSWVAQRQQNALALELALRRCGRPANRPSARAHRPCPLPVLCFTHDGAACTHLEPGASHRGRAGGRGAVRCGFLRRDLSREGLHRWGPVASTAVADCAGIGSHKPVFSDASDPGCGIHP